MNPPVYRITGKVDDGSRSVLIVQQRLAYYDNPDSAKRALRQLLSRNGRWHRRRYSDIRIEYNTGDWRAE